MNDVHVRVINLAHRSDRREECRAEFFAIGLEPGDQVFFEARRVSEDGALGCALSHAMVLAEYLADFDAPFALVLEDDFSFKDKEKVQDRIATILRHREHWDVYLLAHNQSVPVAGTRLQDVFRVFNAQTTAGYLVRREFAPKLISSFFRSAEYLRSFLRLPVANRKLMKHFVAVDMLWKELQVSDRFLAGFPAEVGQRPSYSDVENIDVDYRV